ncbi:hypothetical protein JW758_05075 [Candidatus Peregrinibacteria bacterium]|nr:hypothetical protein [Candidatus Peregrinibacteria bacterium]
MKRMILMALILSFACFACDDEDCSCSSCPDDEAGDSTSDDEPSDDEPSEEVEIWEEVVTVTVVGDNVAERKVYAYTCSGTVKESGPKDPVDPEAESYEYIFTLDAPVISNPMSEDGYCYRIVGSQDPNCTVTSEPSIFYLTFDNPVDVTVEYDCSL